MFFMKTEISAGGVVIANNKILIIKDMNGNWTFPKGIIENNEDPLSAAKREIKEEVAIAGLKLLKKLTPIQYSYTRGQLIKKTVRYFLFHYKGNIAPKPQKEEGISQVRWVTLEEAMGIIGYPKTNKKVLEEVRWILN